ncbi:MAG: redoxin domain-containing protein [Myxococcaceae bacterium]|nr:redoxin domain-containing protein [Myxococcaceae bacterium]
MNRNVILAIVGVLGAAFFIAVMLSFGNDPHAVPFMLEGKPAPAFSMKRLDADGTVNLADLKGKPVVLNFWATWCGPCAQEHPVLEWAAKKYGNDAVFIGVVFEDTEEATKKFLAQRGSSFQQLYDPQSTMAVDYGVTGVPETYFIDRNHVIVSKYAAPINMSTFDKHIAQILK